jgi:hypothetical protein
MQYAILCYDREEIVEGWTQAEDDAVIAKHRAVEHDLAKKGRLGPTLRLLPTHAAMTVRSGDQPLVLDGPFAETKEQLLGLWIIDADSHEEALETAKKLASHKKTGALEVRPLRHFAAQKQVA